MIYIFFASLSFHEMKAAVVRVCLRQICCSGLTSPPAFLPIGHVSIHDVPPNSVLLCQTVGLVRACRPKCRVVRLFFPSADSNPGAFVVFTHKFWRGVGSFSCLGAPMCFFAHKLKFCGNTTACSFCPNVQRETRLA